MGATADCCPVCGCATRVFSLFFFFFFMGIWLFVFLSWLFCIVQFLVFFLSFFVPNACNHYRLSITHDGVRGGELYDEHTLKKKPTKLLIARPWPEICGRFPPRFLTISHCFL